ncbi:MAG TPA: hypothetical protein VF170_07910 [Planctomycetaceae bacterium]
MSHRAEAPDREETGREEGRAEGVVNGEPRRRLPPHTRYGLIAFYAMAPMAGAGEAIGGEWVPVLLLAFWAFTVAWWAAEDVTAREGRRISTPRYWVFALFLFVAVAVYIVRSRGWRGLGWVAVNGGGGAAMFAAGYLLAERFVR